jgi:hypothetical protein
MIPGSASLSALCASAFIPVPFMLMHFTQVFRELFELLASGSIHERPEKGHSESQLFSVAD